MRISATASCFIDTSLSTLPVVFPDSFWVHPEIVIPTIIAVNKDFFIIIFFLVIIIQLWIVLIIWIRLQRYGFLCLPTIVNYNHISINYGKFTVSFYSKVLVDKEKWVNSQLIITKYLTYTPNFYYKKAKDERSMNESSKYQYIKQPQNYTNTT